MESMSGSACYYNVKRNLHATFYEPFIFYGFDKPTDRIGMDWSWQIINVHHRHHVVDECFGLNEIRAGLEHSPPPKAHVSFTLQNELVQLFP